MELRSWKREELYQSDIKNMSDTGASISCQNNYDGILSETISKTPITIQCGTGSTTSGNSGIKLIFMEDAYDDTTAHVILLNVNVVPGLTLKGRTIISPHLLNRNVDATARYKVFKIFILPWIYTRKIYEGV